MKKLLNNDVNTKLIEKYIKDNKLTVDGFCKFCNISKNVYYKIFSGKSDFRVSAVFKIARAMGIHIKDMFNKNR